MLKRQYCTQVLLGRYFLLPSNYIQASPTIEQYTTTFSVLLVQVHVQHYRLIIVTVVSYVFIYYSRSRKDASTYIYIHLLVVA